MVTRYQTSEVFTPLNSRSELTPPTLYSFAEKDLEKYQVVQGDRLDRLAFHLLGDSRWWWLLADVNREILTDTLRPPIGVELQVPTLKALERLYG